MHEYLREHDKGRFSQDVRKEVKYKILDSLVINFDQTGLSLVPSSQWAMDPIGSKQVPIAGIGGNQ